MRTDVEFRQQIDDFHLEIQQAAQEWAAWRKRIATKRASHDSQPSTADLMSAIQQILTEIASLKTQQIT